MASEPPIRDADREIKAAVAAIEPSREEPKAVAKAQIRTSHGSGFFRALFEATPAEVGSYVLRDVILPSVKDIISEMVTAGIERALYGEARSSRHARPGRTPSGIFTSAASTVVRPKARIEEAPKRVTDYRDISYSSRSEADSVLWEMTRRIERYGRATVGDLMTLSGLSASYVDERWYWTDLAKAGIRSSRNGYILTLPEPVDTP